MNLYLLGAILVWSVFWIGYSLYGFNSGSFPYKVRKILRAEKPLLFHTELIVSVFWAFSGYAMLFYYLAGYI